MKQARKNVVYVARYTECPEYDVRRGWSAWMDYEGDTRQEALFEWLGEHADATDEEIAELRIRKHKHYGKYVVVHHDGLSCYKLDASNSADAVAEARSKHESGDIEWSGVGDQTEGKVRLVERVLEVEGGWLCIFSCADTCPEGLW